MFFFHKKLCVFYWSRLHAFTKSFYFPVLLAYIKYVASFYKIKYVQYGGGSFGIIYNSHVMYTYFDTI